MRIRGAVLRESGRGRPYGGSVPLDVVELELLPPGRNEVLVEIEAASVCHSDLSVVNGSRPRPTPMLLGHEGAGRVLATGDEVDDIAVGDRVVLTFLPRWGECAACHTEGVAPCTRGSASNAIGMMLDGGTRLREGDTEVLHHLGASAFASHAVVDRRSVVAVPDDVPADVAAVLGCAVLTGGGAVINSARPKRGERIAIVGMGGVGMAAMLTALAHDGVEVVAIDSAESKRVLAMKLGAHRALAPEEAADVKCDIVIEAAGRAVAFQTAIRCTAPGGRTVSVGLPAPDDLATISPVALVAEGRTIIGSYLGSSVPSRDIPIFADLWRKGRLPVEKLITTTVPLNDINEAMDNLADGSELRQIIDPRGASS